MKCPHCTVEVNPAQDGNLVTGQQQNSGAAAAELVVELLTK